MQKIKHNQEIQHAKYIKRKQNANKKAKLQHAKNYDKHKRKITTTKNEK